MGKSRRFLPKLHAISVLHTRSFDGNFVSLESPNWRGLRKNVRKHEDADRRRLDDGCVDEEKQVSDKAVNGRGDGPNGGAWTDLQVCSSHA